MKRQIVLKKEKGDESASGGIAPIATDSSASRAD